jgi:hypothetical protein
MSQPVSDSVPTKVTCETDGCMNKGIAITILLAPGTDEVICGPCGMPIEKIEPVKG